MIQIPSLMVPEVVKEMLAIQNCKGWLQSNYCDYYPEVVNFKNDKIVRYKQLKNGEYAIVKTFFQS